MKTLIIYALYKETKETDFFFRNGIIDDDTVHYVFTVNDLNFSPSEEFMKAIVKLGDRCKVLYGPNLGYDFGGYSHAVKHLSSSVDLYDYFIFMNQTLMGPFFPVWYKDPKNNWAKLFTDKIDEETKLVGTTINCFYYDMSKKEDIYCPHVQSMLFATDKVGLNLLMTKGILNPIKNEYEGGKTYLVMTREVKMSQIMIKNNYNIGCMLYCAEGVDFREPRSSYAWTDPLFPNEYFGENIHPFEVIFLKNNRKISSELIGRLIDKKHNKPITNPNSACEHMPIIRDGTFFQQL